MKFIIIFPFGIVLYLVLSNSIIFLGLFVIFSDLFSENFKGPSRNIMDVSGKEYLRFCELRFHGLFFVIVCGSMVNQMCHLQVLPFLFQKKQAILYSKPIILMVLPGASTTSGGPMALKRSTAPTATASCSVVGNSSLKMGKFYVPGVI